MALEGMGETVRDVIIAHLGQRGIPKVEISTRFDDVVKVLTDTFGTSARIIIYRTMIELYKEYSLTAEFTYQDSLRDRFILLRDRVLADHLMPRHSQKGMPDDQFLAPSYYNQATPIIVGR